MREFEELLKTVEHLLGPNGCPWDQVQTMSSIRSCIVEESSELIDAIDLDDNEHIQEELGDLFFVVIFLCKLAEKEKRCHISDVLRTINEKLIRRHPHVFGNVQEIDSPEKVLKQWGEIKQQEKGKTHRKSVLDSIPKGLPALSRAQKVFKKLNSAKYEGMPAQDLTLDFSDEDSLGKALWNVVRQAQEKDLDAEHALRKILAGLESNFREYESNVNPTK